MQTVKLYKVTTTYANPYYRDHWEATPATNEVHPSTGLEYDDYTDGGPVEFVLPDGIGYDDDAGMLYDRAHGTYLQVDTDEGGEPVVYGYAGRTYRLTRA